MSGDSQSFNSPYFLKNLKHSTQTLDHHHLDHSLKLLIRILILLLFPCHVKMIHSLYAGQQGYLKEKDILNIF